MFLFDSLLAWIANWHAHCEGKIRGLPNLTSVFKHHPNAPLTREVKNEFKCPEPIRFNYRPKSKGELALGGGSPPKSELRQARGAAGSAFGSAGKPGFEYGASETSGGGYQGDRRRKIYVLQGMRAQSGNRV